MRGEIFNEINANPISKINIFFLSKCEIGNIFATSKCNNFWNALHLTSKGVETEKLRKRTCRKRNDDKINNRVYLTFIQHSFFQQELKRVIRY